MFFSSEYSYSEHVPLVALPGVDDSYPPQKKSFRMLKYMYDHFIDQYEWFVRADDDVYIRTDRLEELLRSVDSRKAWFIGKFLPELVFFTNSSYLYSIVTEEPYVSYSYRVREVVGKKKMTRNYLITETFH